MSGYRYTWNEVRSGVATTSIPRPKTFGPVQLPSGRVIYRNYHRELKNGKGLTWLDVLELKFKARYEELSKIVYEPLFNG